MTQVTCCSDEHSWICCGTLCFVLSAVVCFLLLSREECVLCSNSLEWEAGFVIFFKAIVAEGEKESRW